MSTKFFKRSVNVLVAIVILFGASGIAYALSGTYNYASSGSYYYEYGPTQYWHTTTNAGYCGHISSSCSPNSMRWTYNNGCFPSNYAKWDNIDSAQNGIHKVFIPGVNATTNGAPYTLTYNVANTYTFSINQNAYYDVWIQTGTFYDIRNTWLDDNTCESDLTKKVGFDEVRIIY